MPMLRLNGMTIPVAVDELRLSWDEDARVTRQATGQLSRDARRAKRKWECKTKPIPWEEANLLRMLAYGPSAYVWGAPYGVLIGGPPPSAIAAGGGSSFWGYSAATAADGFSVLNAAKFGTHAMAPAYTNTNLWTGNIATGTDTNSASTGFAAVGTAALASTTTAKWQGSRSLQLTVVAAGDGFTTAGATVSNGTRYYATFYIRSAVSGTFSAELLSNGAVVVTRSFTTSTTQWKRISVDAIATNTAAFVMRIRQTSGTGIHYLDGFQLESHQRSPWDANGRANATYAVYPMVSDGLLGSAAGLTMTAWVTPTTLVDAAVLTMWDSDFSPTQSKVSLRCNSATGDALKLVTIEPAGTPTRTLTSNGFTWPSDMGWTHVAAVIRPNPGTPNLALYINGSLNASSSPGVAWSMANLDRLFLCNDNGINHWNNPIDQVSVYPFALSGEAIAALYASSAGGALPGPWPLMVAAGDFIPEGGTVSVYLTVTGMEIVQAYTPSGQFQNHVVMGLELEEN